MSNAAEKLTIAPLRPAEFGLDQHRVRRFNAVVPGQYAISDLEDPALWASVAGQLEMGAEVRCLADDMSFVAYGICTFARGAVAKIKIYATHELDRVNKAMIEDASPYQAKLRGPKKWCIVQMATGNVIKDGIPTQAEALRELDDYVRALAR